MIGPTADAVQPGFEHAEFAVGELRVEFFQQQDCGNFLLKYRAGKEFVGHCDQEVEVVLPQNVPSAVPHGAAQGGRIPSVRLDFFFEEPLHAGGVLG